MVLMTPSRQVEEGESEDLRGATDAECGLASPPRSVLFCTPNRFGVIFFSRCRRKTFTRPS